MGSERGQEADGSQEGQSAPPGRWVATSYVSNDLVRSNLVPQLARAGAVLVKLLGADAPASGSGAISSRVMHHVVTSGAGAELANLSIEDFVELIDYDPVRHVALVLGRRPAPLEGPVLWMLHRVFPTAYICCVIPGGAGREPQPLERAPRGSFEEALAVGRALKGAGPPPMSGPAMAVLERVGLVLVVPPTGDIEAAIAAVLGGDEG